MQRNPNFITVVLDKGGHCDFYHDYYDQNKHSYKHFVPELALEYFSEVEAFNN